MENKQEMREYLRQKANREIIMKYLFVKEIEGRYDDEYIKTRYRINAATIRGLYSALSDEDKKEVESTIKKQIEAGEINLNKEAVNWHREDLNRSANGEKRNENDKTYKGEGR